MGDASKAVVRRAFARLAIWVIAMVFALLPGIVSVPYAITDFRPESLARQIKDAGAFKDFFFVGMVAAILGSSNVVDSVFRQIFKGKLKYTSPFQFWAILAILYYVIFLISGIVHFTSMTAAIPDAVFTRDFWLIIVTLAISMAVEILIAFYDS